MPAKHIFEQLIYKLLTLGRKSIKQLPGLHYLGRNIEKSTDSNL